MTEQQAAIIEEMLNDRDAEIIILERTVDRLDQKLRQLREAGNEEIKTIGPIENTTGAGVSVVRTDDLGPGQGIAPPDADEWKPILDLPAVRTGGDKCGGPSVEVDC